MKKQTNKTPKTVNKPKRELVVNLCDVNDLSDLYYKVAIAKCNAQIELTSNEFLSIYMKGLFDAYTIMSEYIKLSNIIEDVIKDEEKNSKQPWYKKMWKKITNPFRKNK